MQASHTWRGESAVFDEDNLVSHAGLVPVMELAEQTGLSQLLDEHVRFGCERVRSGAANPTPKLTSIIAGMACGADSIDDLDVIRAGGMNKLFGGVYANATLGIFLREFTHGHARQLAAVLRRHLIALAARTPLLVNTRRDHAVEIVLGTCGVLGGVGNPHHAAIQVVVVQSGVAASVGLLDNVPDRVVYRAGLVPLGVRRRGQLVHRVIAIAGDEVR